MGRHMRRRSLGVEQAVIAGFVAPPMVHGIHPAEPAGSITGPGASDGTHVQDIARAEQYIQQHTQQDIQQHSQQDIQQFSLPPASAPLEQPLQQAAAFVNANGGELQHVVTSSSIEFSPPGERYQKIK